jgi:hypothetical protein
MKIGMSVAKQMNEDGEEKNGGRGRSKSPSRFG